MITLINLSYNTRCEVVPTIFPDKTSQVWKLPKTVLIEDSIYQIVWDFKAEAELMHLSQLLCLLEGFGTITEITIPFLPYARQDKGVSNFTTFARKCFLDQLKFITGKIRVTCLDVHSPVAGVINLNPIHHIHKAIEATGAEIICYPDEGAWNRYSAELPMDCVVLDKVRDQETGKITGMSISDEDKELIKDKKILIVDDICDGGATFINAARLLKKHYAYYIHLYTTHGIYSQGTSVLFQSDIDRIFNYKGEVYAK